MNKNTDKNYKADLRTIIVSFAMQPIIKNGAGSKESVEKLGFSLPDKANTLKIKSHSGALMSIVYIVSMVHSIETLIEESMIRMSRHPQKEVREFVAVDITKILSITSDHKTMDQDGDITYFNFIIHFLNKLGIYDVVEEINR